MSGTEKQGENVDKNRNISTGTAEGLLVLPTPQHCPSQFPCNVLFPAILAAFHVCVIVAHPHTLSLAPDVVGKPRQPLLTLAGKSFPKLPNPNRVRENSEKVPFFPYSRQ